MSGNLRDNPSHRQRASNALPRLPLLAWLLLLGVCGVASGQRPVHYFHSAHLPPGTVGQGQLLRGGPLPGYFQPVEIQAPRGARISLAVDGQFQSPQEAPVMAGMLIGAVYRFKVSGIPRREGFEVFPTIEVINRLYPPPGLATHFPIPVQLTQEELEMALSGNFVTRVIYLENPNNALPVQSDPQRQLYYEVRGIDDPLQVADRLGRPVAILRMGSRVPDFDAVSQRFLFDSPPLLPLTKPAPLPDRRSGLEDPPENNGVYRRVPLAPSAASVSGDGLHRFGNNPSLR
ncbi:MAG: hypothetical protein KJ000_09160 [Pirellulaceae bacterium]|nr:hypothetical protein [Pirellulaceae bacterium]